ncbi:Ribosome biogenesis protein SLX9 [Lachancea thermotolerans]|uniref:Ribosome biogenesis protein SLX9 n=1 Tax=Lachancea thermotolerans (strain ATCC 56472 / CBS 6340 / NRRL Y-8284) TaxID=559295 RepID=C5DL89_LACTC|nr:KLTH0F10934p [Lachancea thermotolerans CBS 6340]CAR24240.1 KLTH0F10934p [Lachancea thermotolerans CBS 6340]
MVAKKRSQLRAKAALRLGRSKDEDDSEPTSIDLPEDPKAFLHLPRESKKDKMMSKSQSFLSKLHENTSINGAISKSAIRRRKRKLRDQLKPKMEDLLVSLEKDGVTEALEIPGSEEEGSTRDSTERKTTRITRPPPTPSTGSVIMRKNQPSIRNQRGAKQLAQKESDRFQSVLQNKQFQQDPFAALKEVIKMQKS